MKKIGCQEPILNFLSPAGTMCNLAQAAFLAEFWLHAAHGLASHRLYNLRQYLFGG
jgi:hypothetical protein